MTQNRVMSDVRGAERIITADFNQIDPSSNMAASGELNLTMDPMGKSSSEWIETKHGMNVPFKVLTKCS